MHPIKTIKQANTDIWLLWGSVFLRMLSFGLSNQILTLFLQEIGISESNIGVFMTLTLLGDVVLSYILAWNADKIGRRSVLVIGTVMMLASGLVFSSSSKFVALLLAAIFGVISPSGDETGPFKSIEEVSLAHLTPHNHRPEVFAFHGLFGTVGAALGALTSGILVDYLNLTLSWDIETCYRAIFVLYSIIAVAKLIIMLSLSDKCELDCELEDDYEDLPTESTALAPDVHEYVGENRVAANSNSESLHIISNPEPVSLSEAEANTTPPPVNSGSTLSIASRLTLVFFLDSLGYGFMPSSWVIYYFKTFFKVSSTALGVLFFLTNMMDSITTLPSAFLAKLLGPVKAILFTQAPSAVFFILVSLTSNFYLAATLLVLYFSTATMDVVPRQILLTSIVNKKDLIRVMGTVNIAKTLARCIGPVFTGKLAEHKKLFFGFIINGSCVLMADLILGVSFVSLDKEIKKKQSVDHSIN